MSIEDQVPVASEFHAKSTAAEVIADHDLSGKTAVVTGGYSGLGLETVRVLAGAGAKVFVPVRSPEKAAKALAGIDGDVMSAAMDLSNLGSVRAFAAEVHSQVSTLDLLINNAGIMACPEGRVGPGWESQFGTNHMGHFALTKALMPLLETAGAARVVALSSAAHRNCDIMWDDIQWESTDYDKWKAYGQSKTANALFANALSRRLKDAGGLAFSLHPGGIFTPLQRHLPKEEMIALGWLGEDGEPSEMAQRAFKTPEQGASTTVWAATSTLLADKPGVYCEDCNIAELHNPDHPTKWYLGVKGYACRDDSAERLWEISENLLASA